MSLYILVTSDCALPSSTTLSISFSTIDSKSDQREVDKDSPLSKANFLLDGSTSCSECGRLFLLNPCLIGLTPNGLPHSLHRQSVLQDFDFW